MARIVLEDFTTPGITFQEITLNQLMLNVSFHNHGKSDDEVAKITSTLLDLGADDLIVLQNEN